VTDTESVVRADEAAKPGVTNLLRIYSALSGETIDSISARYGDSGYGKFKRDLGELVVDTFSPIRERTAKILADPGALDGVLLDGARRARRIAGATMTVVRDRCGLPPVA
jgi:tryptophanyl-tRNA synthetase